MRIAQSLGTSLNWLLGAEEAPRSGLIERLVMAGEAMSEVELAMTVVQAEAVVRSSH